MSEPKIIEFDCSQEKLLETIKNLDAQLILKPYCLGDAGELDVFGYTKLLIQKERPLKREELSTLTTSEKAQGVTFEAIGYITIGKVNDDISTLIIRSENTDLLQFFDMLLAIFPDYNIINKDSIVEKDERILDLDKYMEETAKNTGGEVTNISKMLQSLGQSISEASKIHSVLETAAQFASGATSIIDVARLASQKSSVESTLNNLKSMGGVLGMLSAHGYLQEREKLEGNTLDEFVYNYDDSKETKSDLKIIEPRKTENLSRDEIEILMNRYDNQISILNQKVTELQNLVKSSNNLQQNTKLSENIKRDKQMNSGTKKKITDLAKYRENIISEENRVPGWIDSCKVATIDSRIVKKYAIELSENWDDKNYKWLGFEGN